MRLAGVLVTLLVLAAGCSSPYVTGGDDGTPTAAPTATDPPGTPATPAAETPDPGTTPVPERPEPDDTPPPEPSTDRLGWEDGYWYNSTLSVTTEDGLNESEREAVLARTMARVEVIRGLEFNRSVPLEIITRAEHKRRSNAEGPNDSETFEDWNNQVWEALFLVPEGNNVSDAFDTVVGSTVQGYYSSRNASMVIVSETRTPTVDRATLAHELVHALQDQHFGLGETPATQDAQLAQNGVIEGEANYVERLYAKRCEGDWDCIARPEDGGQSTPDDFNVGVFLTIFQPYSEGPGFVERVHTREGWDGVNDLHRNYPASTEQVIHPVRYPDEEPVEVVVEDRSSEDWSRFDRNQTADTVGEASIYAMFWANGQIDRRGSAVFNYSHELSAGWGGDSVVPYRSQGGEFGYVWVTVWDTPEDAREFREGYGRVLERRGAREVSDGVFVLPKEQPFGDAFRVTSDGTEVTIVNAPTAEGIDEIHPRAGATTGTMRSAVARDG